MVILAPLEQFEVFDVLPTLSFLVLWLTGTYVSNSTLFTLLAFTIIFVLVDQYKISKFLVPTKVQLAQESVLNFTLNLVKENIGVRYLNNVALVIWFLLMTLLTLNLLGMVPYSFTVTSHFIITLTLSLSLFIALNIVGVKKHGLNMLRLFVPEGAPKQLLPLLFIIEVISYLARIFSLAIRLFANLMSGHTLLKILAGFAWLMFLTGGFAAIGGIFPFIIIFLVTGLELAIGALQAYVFCMLICLYYNDVIHLH